MAEKTKRSDVVATFHRYMGRNPQSPEDWRNVEFLTTKAPEEVERRLSEIGEKIKKQAGQNRVDSAQGNIDPIKVAQSLGYTANDFSNDPEFINYWKNKSKAELEEALKRRADYNDRLGRKMTPIEIQQEREDREYYSSLGLSPLEAEAIKAQVDTIDTDKVPTEEELAQMARRAEEGAREDVSDYYQDVEKRDFEDLRGEYADIRNESQRFGQQEAKSYAEKLADTKQSLRARGLTFSGRSRGTLGKESAIGSKGVEGELPQQRRYDIEDRRAGWQQRARDIGTEAERLYGSAKLSRERDFLEPEGLFDPYGDGIDYTAGRTSSIYTPHKNRGQRGYVSPEQADIEKEKELEVQRRKEDRLKTKSYY